MTILKPSQLKIGSKWKRVDGSNQIVTIVDLNEYKSSDPFDDPWVEVVYSWVDPWGHENFSDYDYFSFQCRYKLIKQ